MYEMFKYQVTSDFGVVDNAHKIPHSGIDLACPIGTKAQALFPGKISDIVLNDAVLGKAIYLTNSNGETLVYGHLSKIMVYKGQPVLQGHILGLTGNTGRSTGEHLHLALFDKGGIPLDVNIYNQANSILDRIGIMIGEKLSDGISSCGIFLLDAFKVMILAYMIWSCYCLMMKLNKIGLPPFSQARPLDALFINCMFFAILTLAQGVLLK